jgi:hypothetical protein
MISKAVLLAAGVAILSSTAFAQAPSRDEPGQRRSDTYRSDDRDWGDHRGGWDRMSDHMDRGGEPSARRGASFFLRNGNTSLGMRCGSGESLQTCVDAATKLMDRARSLQSGPPNAPVPQ